MLLNVRDPDSWYESTLATLYPSSQGGAPPPPPTSDRDRIMHVVYREVWAGIFEGRFTDRAFAIRRFQQYNDEVRDTIDPERLLVWNVKDGWEPLCRWLESEIPEEPFPHQNTRKAWLNRLS